MSAKSPHDELSLQEAADLLGVHYMTAYRYVRTGRLAARLSEGKWRVRRSSLDRMQQPERAGRAKRGATTNHRHYVRGLTEQLVQGDETEAWRLLQQGLTSAFTPEDLYLEVLVPALRRVGDQWAAGHLSIAQEHRASAVVSRLIGRLGPSLIRRGVKRGHVVLGAPSDDHHGLPTALVADVLRGRGYSVTDLGAHTPFLSFVETIGASDQLVGTGVVVSAPLHDKAIAPTIAAIKAASEAPLLLGGVTIRDERHARRLGADAWTNSTRAAADWFDATARS
jgi:MerR family transcriptional regulator, light-induced transcriptional regulator